jgi:hypothetical protein
MALRLAITTAALVTIGLPGATLLTLIARASALLTAAGATARLTATLLATATTLTTTTLLAAALSFLILKHCLILPLLE